MVRHTADALGDSVTALRQDLVELALPEPVDVVFSNATFHWIADHDALFSALYRNLSPGGRLLAQCGGRGNIDAFRRLAEAVAAEQPFAPFFEGWVKPWNYATAEATAARLEHAGFAEVSCWLEDRPTTPEEPRSFVSTVCLVRHLDPLPSELREPLHRTRAGARRLTAGARVRASEHDGTASLGPWPAGRFAPAGARVGGELSRRRGVLMFARWVGLTRGRRSLWLALLTGAAVLIGAWPAAGRATRTAAAARLWLTTADGRYKLTDMGTVPFTSAQSSAPTIVLDSTRRFQTMAGFGGAITDSSAVVLYRLSPAARARAMRMLFDPRTGDALSYLRQPVGASDFVAGRPYTYDDRPAGQTDYGQRHFSIAHDRAEILPLLRQARRLNPRLQIIATPWSAPAWMKTNQSLIGGRLIDSSAIYRSYALYLTKFVEAYRAAGVTVDTITVQNEPQNHQPRRLSRHRHAGHPAGEGDRSARPDAAPGRPAHEDPGLRPQLVRASQRHSCHPTG